MKNPILFLLTFVFIFGLLIQPGCKTSDESGGQYILTVTVGTGVSGIPATGTYSYDAGQTVSYNYTLGSCSENLVVTIDGTPIGDSGLITMNSNHILNVTSDEIFNPSDDWEGMCYWSYDFPLWVTFNGDCSSGTTEGRYDTYGLHTGTYTISGNQITFTLVLGSYDWLFEGTIDDNNNMSGTWVNQISNNGTWDLVRQ